MTKIGTKAPNFSAPKDGGDIVNLEDYKGKYVVLYFYPKDDTPGCTVEAKQFADLAKDFESANAVILGVSKDTVAKHDKFKDKYCLPFSLISDEDTKICQAYNVWVEKSMYGKKYMGIQRDTFLISPDGAIIEIWNKVKPDGHAAAVLERIQSNGTRK